MNPNFSSCHPDRPSVARGMCRTCYGKAWRSGELGPRPIKAKTIPTCGHPDRDNAAYGMCRACYSKERRKDPDVQQDNRDRALRSYYEKRDDPEFKRLRSLQARARTYDISLSQVIAILEEFDNKCAVCSSTERLVIDHCHETGRVRGVLCGKCNSALGFVDDSTERLGDLIDYLTS